MHAGPAAPAEVPPSEFKGPVNPPLRSEATVLELFCGSGTLAAAFAREGFAAVGVDHRHNRHRVKCKTLTIDLAGEVEQQRVLRIISEDPCLVLVWLSMPGGSFSRARDLPLAGAALPRLRSESEPAGRAAASPANARQLSRENSLAQFTANVIACCMTHKICWALEHPWRSYAWSLESWKFILGFQHSTFFSLGIRRLLLRQTEVSVTTSSAA